MSCDDPQNKMILATGGYDHTIHFWFAHSGVRQFSVQHPSSRYSGPLDKHDSPYGENFCFVLTGYLTYARPPEVYIFNVSELFLVAKMNRHSWDISPHLDYNTKPRLTGFQHIRMYDIHSNNANPVVNYEGPQKNFTAVGFQEEGRWMFTGSEDNAAKIWDLRSRTLQCQRMFATNAPVNCVCLHPNQSELYIGDQSGAIYLWDLRSENTDLQLKKPYFKVTEPHISIQSIHIDTEGTSMAAVDNKGNCYFFTLSGGSENPYTQPARKMKFQAHNTYALKCKFSPDSTLLVTTSADCSAKIWRTSDLQLLLEQPNSPLNEKSGESDDSVATSIAPMIKLTNDNQRWVWDIAFSADSQYLFTASSDNLARLWNISTGEVKREYSGHSKALTALAFKDGA